MIVLAKIINFYLISSFSIIEVNPFDVNSISLNYNANIEPKTK